MSLSCNICILSADYLNPLHNKLPNRYRSHKASYSNLIPKIDSHGNDLYNLEIGCLQRIAWPQKPTSRIKYRAARYRITQLKL